jgi:hypothetical protein
MDYPVFEFGHCRGADLLLFVPKQKSGIETTGHAEPNSIWNVPAGKDGSVFSSAVERDYPSRPVSSFIQFTPAPLLRK